MALRKTLPDSQLLNLDETRLVSDLRIMHSKVDELYHLIDTLKRRHSHKDVYRYADGALLAENISRVDEIYIWLVRLKEEAERKRLNRA
jgi:hypothetical protein